ncbi:hypothetical protein M434DRAFT_86236 [Hypoxylon sp. CO27-5]|nr:hypothetical protein M434DRAFT_86236 [Hypoxylon sp. CO27-5]
MPVTLRLTSHPSRAWEKTNVITSAEQLLRESCPTEDNRCHWVMESSFGFFANSRVFASSNAFVRAAYYAYSYGHHLKIRPEDVWFSILSQLSFHINTNPEKLGSFFVTHEGQKSLEVIDSDTIISTQFENLATRMKHEIEKNVRDPQLRTWIIPDFSTTTNNDVVTAAILMMGTTQRYSPYRATLVCGIPSVTLLGEKEDWIKIRNRLDFLPRLGEEPQQFGRLLVPVLNYFVRSFEEPTSPEVISFWSKIVHKSSGSGPYHLSGWITSLCFWEANGKCLYKPPMDSDGCDIDGTLFHRIDIHDIPNGFASVPVTVIDEDMEVSARMVAGSVCIQVSSSGELLDTLQPGSGWWIYKLQGIK